LAWSGIWDIFVAQLQGMATMQASRSKRKISKRVSKKISDAVESMERSKQFGSFTAADLLKKEPRRSSAKRQIDTVTLGRVVLKPATSSKIDIKKIRIAVAKVSAS
jgi:hypothetical protein